METDTWQKFLSACKDGDASTVNALLPHIDPTQASDLAFREAVYRGHAMVVDLLLRDQRLDPTTRRNAALREALQRAHIDVVILLLADYRVQLGIAREGLEIKSLLLGVYKKAMNNEEAVLRVVNHKTALLT